MSDTCYLNFLLALSDRAVTAGYPAEHWQEALVAALHSGPRISARHFVDAKGDSAVELRGGSLSLFAKCSQGRDDTLFVFRIGSNDGTVDVREQVTELRFVASDGKHPRLPDAPAARLVARSREAASVAVAGPAPNRLSRRDVGGAFSPQCEAALVPLIQSWAGNDFVGRIASTRDDDLPQALARTRRAYLRLGRAAVHVPLSEHDRLVLKGTVTPKNLHVIRTLSHKFGLELIATLFRLQRAELEASLPSILEVPPPEAALRVLADLWLRTSPADELLARIETGRQRVRAGFVSETADWLRLLDPSAWLPASPAPPAATQPEGKQTGQNDGPRDVAESEPPQAFERDAAEFDPPRPIEPPPQDDAPPSTEAAAFAASEDGATPASLLSDQLRALRLAEEIDTARAAAAIDRARDELGRHRGVLAEVGDLAAVRRELERLSAELSELARSLPDRHLLESVGAEVETVAAQILASPRLFPEIDWLRQAGRWPAVLEIVDLVRNPRFPELPPWFFGAALGRDITSPETGSLVDPDARAVLARALRWLAELTATQRTFVPMLRPFDDPDPLRQLQRSLEAEIADRTARAEFERFAERIGPWVLGVLDGDLPADEVLRSLQAIEQDLCEVSARAPKLADAVRAELHAIGSLPNAHGLLRDLGNAFTAVEGVAPGILLEFSSLSHVRAIARRAGGPVAAEAMESLEIRHCLSEESGFDEIPRIHAARLVALPHPGEEGLYVADVPLTLTSSHRRTRDVHISVDAQQLLGRKATWASIGREHELHVDAGEWEEVRNERLPFATTIVLHGVPFVRAHKDNARVSRWTMTVSGGDGSTTLAPVNFAFENVSFDAPQLAQTLVADTTPPEEMHRHPLGLQHRFAQIRDTIAGGAASFLVVAPRRFGKSTLLDALATHFDGSEIVVVGPVRALPEEGITGAFVQASQMLSSQINCNISTDWARQELLPPVAAFDQACEAARKLGKRAIYLLFDEAQAMFLRRWRGQEAAEQLKARLEARWARDRPTHVPIRIGLVGQPQLFRLISGQLDAFFAGNTHSGNEIKSYEIEKLLRERSRGVIQSTREARALLGAESRSLLVLRGLMQSLTTIMSTRRRTWFVRSDVQAASEDFVRLAVESPHHPYRTYIRDPLNASDNLTDWRPVAAYPVALAWALALREKHPSRSARVDRMRELLDRWAAEFAGGGRVAHARIDAAIITLQGVAVLDSQEQFSSQILQRFLADLAGHELPLQGEPERRALQALTVDVVEMPAVLAPLGRGGQAEVFVGRSGDRDVAVRRVELQNEQERLAFIEMCRALKAIEGTRSRARGYQSLPVTREAGFTDETAAIGVVSYDFVPGNTLEERKGQLSLRALVHIGRAIADALAILAQRKVVHRDLKPNNIVLGPDGTPVLVDFGLARLLERAPVTGFDDSHHRAPEVRHPPARWSAAADVYALAVTLQELAAPGATTARFQELLGRAMAEDPMQRLSADRLSAELVRIADEVQVDAARADLDASFARLCEGLQERWAVEVARRYTGEMVGTGLGVFGWTQVLPSVSQLLQDMFEEWYSRTYQGGGPLGDKLSLSQFVPDVVRNRFHNTILQTLVLKETVAVGHLRHGNAHKRNLLANVERARAQLGSRDDRDLIRAVVLVTKRVSSLIRIDLNQLVEGWMTVNRTR